MNITDDSISCTFLRDFNPEKRTAEILTPQETERIRKRLGELFEDSRWMHAMQWEKGDFAILDNLALVHYGNHIALLYDKFCHY